MKKSEILRAPSHLHENKSQFKNKTRNLEELSPLPSEHVSNRSFEILLHIPSKIHLDTNIREFNFLYLHSWNIRKSLKRI